MESSIWTAAGHWPLDFKFGNGPPARDVDLPPYWHEPMIKLRVARDAVTSTGSAAQHGA